MRFPLYNIPKQREGMAMKNIVPLPTITTRLSAKTTIPRGTRPTCANT